MRKVSMLTALMFWMIVGIVPSHADDWPMANKDSNHSGHVTEGPVPPLKQAWAARTLGSGTTDTRWPVVVGDTVYVSSGGSVLAFESSNGRRKWEAKPPEGQEMVAPAVDDRGVYIPVPGGKMLALDRHTGRDLWRFQAASRIDRSPSISDGRLYFGSAEAKTFYCVDTATGTLVWKSELDLEPYTAPVVSGGLTVFSVRDLTAPGAFVIALNSGSGDEVWRVPQESVTSSPAILDNKVIVGSYDFSVSAYELNSGRQLWKTQVEDAFGEETAPATAFGDVFLSDRVGNFYRLDGETGRRKWMFSDTEGTFDQSSPVIAGRTMFIGGAAGWVYALDADSGKDLWRKQLGGRISSGAADSSRFYVGVKSRNQGVYAFEHDSDGNLAAQGGGRGTYPALWFVASGLIVGLGIAFLVRRTRMSTKSYVGPDREGF